MTTQLTLDWSSTDETTTVVEALDQVRPPKRRPPIASSQRKPAAPTPAPEPAEVLLNRCGRPRTARTLPGAGKGTVPKSKGKRYPPDPVTAEDVNAMLTYLEEPRTKYENRTGHLSRLRLRAMIAVLWRSGLRISEALDLEQRDLNRDDLCVTVRNGKGGKRRISVMDTWGWVELDRWQNSRKTLPSGPVFCVVSGVTAGQSWGSNDVRKQLHHTARAAGVTRRVAPHQLRHAHTVDLWRDDINLFVIMQQLGHARLDVTALYLRSLAPVDVLKPIGHRQPPLMPIRHAA